MADFDDLTRKLEKNRADFLGSNADQLANWGDRLFWLDYHQQWDPTLYVWTGNGSEGKKITELSGDNLNYRASEKFALTAVPEGQNVRYKSFDLNGNALGELVVAAPTTEAKWWAYAADGATAYLVEDNSPDGTLKKWGNSASRATDVTTFSSMGATISEFWDFDVDGKTFIFIESGRIWKANLQANTSEWIRADTQVTGNIAYTADDAVFQTADALLHFDFASGKIRDISQEIVDSSYSLNETFSTIHHATGGAFTRDGSKIVYEGNRGIFAFDLDTGDVEPILLEPNIVPGPDNPRISYRDPVLLPDGLLFVTGLESESGAVGADGPVYKVEHPFLK